MGSEGLEPPSKTRGNTGISKPDNAKSNAKPSKVASIIQQLETLSPDQRQEILFALVKLTTIDSNRAQAVSEDRELEAAWRRAGGEAGSEAGSPKASEAASCAATSNATDPADESANAPATSGKPSRRRRKGVAVT